MKKISILLLLILTLSFLVGCSKKIDYTSDVSSIATSSEEDKGAVNPITGEYGFQENALGTRPYAVMVSNIKAALPQSGLYSADMCYEVLAEGGITRVMAVFANKNKVPKIGPVRSVRDYYVDLAEGLDAILVHFGGSPKGYSVIKSYGTDDIDGLSTSAAFNQDKSRASQRGREHSFYTESNLLNPITKSKDYKTSRSEYSMFKFVDEDAEADMSSGVTATSITVPFSGYCKATFDYDSKTKKYLKGQFDDKQIDANNDKQLSVKNVFVLYTTVSKIPGDKHGRISVGLESGKGKYISNGQMIDITWEKGEHDEAITFYDTDGRDLKVNRGKSWVCIVPKGNLVINDSPQTEKES